MAKVSLKDQVYCINGHKVTEDSLYYTESDQKYRCRLCRKDYAKRHRRIRSGRISPWEKVLPDVADLKHSYRLECSHENIFSVGLPKRGDVVYCYRCTDYRRVLGAARGRKDPD